MCFDQNFIYFFFFWEREGWKSKPYLPRLFRQSVINTLRVFARVLRDANIDFNITFYLTILLKDNDY